MHKTTLLLFLILTTLFANSQEKRETKLMKPQYKSLYTEIIIDAPPEQVWEVLTDFDSYAKWAVFFKGMTGDIKDQGEVTVSFQVKAKRDKLNTRSLTLHYEDGKSFSWNDNVFLGIKDHHQFIILGYTEGKTRFVHSDEFSKGATFMFGIGMTLYLVKKYQSFNRSLKAEVERRFS